MSRFSHILVPSDFSEPSRRALAIGVDLARTFDARLTLLHVWSMLYSDNSEGMTWPVAEMERAAQKALDAAHAEAKALHPKTDAILRAGGEWEQILEAIDEQGVDLVVMGTHGRHGLSRLLVGSVAEKVVRLSPVPVITVGAQANLEEAKP